MSEGGSGQPGGDDAVTLDFGGLAYNIPVGGVCEGGSSQPGNEGAVTLDSGNALGVLAYNIPGGRHV